MQSAEFLKPLQGTLTNSSEQVHCETESKGRENHLST